MLPISDQNPTRTFPFVNYLLIALNVLVFGWQYLLFSTGGEAAVSGLGLVPARFSQNPVGELGNLFASMFMHGSLGHIAGNMLYLYIFGDNVEDAMGHFRYIVFYLACGFIAALAQVVVAPMSPLPMVGASGAIAGALGGYILLYPRAPVTVLNPILPLWLLFGLFFQLPAWLAIGIWFVPNILNALVEESTAGGIAFFAHIGGFVAGMLLVRVATRGRRRIDRGRWSGWRAPPRRPTRGSWSANTSRSWY
ncbi:MAG TPA: rhomboid family intramembrane serine protease [Polyangiaceae bacterium]|nr:rhomboid family intramembrane serine protease [Polyangiaceae bacterium]